jgi:xanthine dehydrogenase molybdopterin-binding subunit B
MTIAEPPVAGTMGTSPPRKEDAHLITGQTSWTDNIQAAGMLTMAFVRSPVAHARIASIDVSEALESEGVVAVFTGAELVDECPSLPCAWPVTEDMKLPGHPPMAVDKVRHAGDPVAVVVARGSSGVGSRRCWMKRRFTTTSALAKVSSMSAPVGIEKKYDLFVPSSSWTSTSSRSASSRSTTAGSGS